MSNLNIYYITSIEEKDKFLDAHKLQSCNFTLVQDFEALDAARIVLGGIRFLKQFQRNVYTGQEVLVNAFRWQLIQPEFRDLQNSVSFYKDGHLYEFDSNMKPIGDFWDYICPTTRPLI
jgi:hypothetical protein